MGHYKSIEKYKQSIYQEVIRESGCVVCLELYTYNLITFGARCEFYLPRPPRNAKPFATG